MTENSHFCFFNRKISKKAFKTIICLLFVSLFCSSGLFAEGIPVLDTAGTKILELVSATWVKALLVVALIIEFGVIAFGNAQGEGGIIKKVLPWIIGTAGILGATSIVNFFFSGITQEGLSMVTPEAITLFV
ncbi:MAG: TrbC/VirB2 family protein [Treponema sp.]|uniref:TrbC/VirB2 family protein n=1 Tax=Treponema sp. TaxID=166 RepID=UPI00298ECB4A|nr:TrbC/VirB2 family protein [Treponema sp.]MCQ2596552.1 TrbC/VirB2 family protein [Treponema sp.]MCQ2601097.1 TrbC/VirB2 family protein [Treponema sp.]